MNEVCVGCRFSLVKSAPDNIHMIAHDPVPKAIPLQSLFSFVRSMAPLTSTILFQKPFSSTSPIRRRETNSSFTNGLNIFVCVSSLLLPESWLKWWTHHGYALVKCVRNEPIFCGTWNLNTNLIDERRG